MDWRFEEDLSCENSLIYTADGMSIIEVKFDNNKKPQLIFRDGAVYWTGLPSEVEKKLKEYIISDYPNGFHSRIDTCLPWLCTKRKEIERELGGQIGIPIPFGGLNVDEEYMNAYKAEVKLGEKKPVQEVIICTNLSKIYVFKKFIRLSELESSDELGIVYVEDIPINLQQNDGTIFFDKYIVLKKYVYERDEQNNEMLRTVSDFFRNDVHGIMASGDMGKYLPIRDVNYL
jgi:hypothetical protein